MRKLDFSWPAIVVAAALLCGVLFGGGCAPTSAYISARQIETGAATFVDTAADTFHAYSHARLENIKEGCADLACFKSVSSQWESGTVAPADKAISTARDAVRAFDAALTTASATKNKNFEGAIQSLIQAITSMVAVLNGFGVNVPAFVAKVL